MSQPGKGEEEGLQLPSCSADSSPGRKHRQSPGKVDVVPSTGTSFRIRCACVQLVTVLIGGASIAVVVKA